MPCCVAFGCSTKKNDKTVSPPITLHQFPLDEEEKKKWILAVKRKNWEPSKRSYLCSKHFTQDCFDRSEFYSKLKKGSMPTILDSYPEHLKLKVSQEQVCKQEDEDSAEQEFQSSLGVVKSVNGPTNQNPQLPKISVAKSSSAAKDDTRRTKRPLVYEADETWRKAKRTLVDKSRTPKSSDPDECEMIGRHVTLQLRQLSLSDMVQANVEIQQVLMRYRLNSIFQDCDSQSSSTEALGTVAAVYPSSPSEHSLHESSDHLDE